MPAVLLAAEYPDLLTLKVGEAFPHPKALQNKDTDRTTTQFRVPNYGSSAALFPEYKVSYLKKSNKVAIVTAEKATRGWKECGKKKEEAAKLAESAYPNFIHT